MSSSESRRPDKRRKARSKRKEDGETPAADASTPLGDDERFDSHIDEGAKLDLDLEEAAADVMSEIVSNICASPGTFQHAAALAAAVPYDPVGSRPAEQPEHERYMNEFRVHLCVAHVDKSCPYDSYTCFDSHSKHTRRHPVLVANDEYNYAPTRCRYVQTMHGKRRCPQGDACRYAHSTEEMIYHPLVYKTQLCPHALSPSSVCTGFGQHCAKAHGPDELRYPAPCNSATDRVFLVRPIPTFSMLLPTDVELGITRDNPAFYMLCYKTDRCPQKSCPRTCERYHNLKERRRCPKFFLYSEQPCPFVKSGGATKNWRDPSRCPDGDACRYSHTLLEQMYHPNIYKTSPCNNYSEQDPSRCTWGPLCTHAHGIADMQRQGRALGLFDRDVTKAASQAILRPAKTASPVVESLSDDSARVRPRFSLPPPLNSNQIWQPTTQDDHALFTRGIWNDPVVPSAASSSWKSELRAFHP